MKSENLAYRDTRNYVPIDVIKGIDLVTGEVVMADDQAPSKAERLPRCKFCAKYAPGKEKGLGTCGADMNGFFTYGDLVATTCGMYEEKK